MADHFSCTKEKKKGLCTRLSYILFLFTFPLWICLSFVCIVFYMHLTFFFFPCFEMRLLEAFFLWGVVIKKKYFFFYKTNHVVL